MSSLDEEFVTMIGGLAAFAAFCIAVLLGCDRYAMRKYRTKNAKSDVK